MKSGIYYTGSGFSKSRLMNLTQMSDNSYKIVKVKRRDNWIAHLEKNVHDGVAMSERNQQRILQWAREAKLDLEHFSKNICTWTN